MTISLTGSMIKQTLFPIDSPVALRQPKTDRLILSRFLKDATADKLYEDYSRNRTQLVAELHFGQKRPLDEAIAALENQDTE